MTSSDEYTYEVVQNKDDLRICAQLLAEEFVKHNEMMRFQGFTTENMFEDDSWPILLDLFDQGLCYLARHRSTGEIVATISAGDLYVAHQKHPYNPNDPPSAYFTFDFLDELDHIFIQDYFGQELKPNMVLQIIMGATQSKYSGKHVATKLRKFMLKNARETREFQYAYVQATAIATRHIYVDKMGGKELSVVDPKTWSWKKKDGSYPFKEYRGEPVPIILIPLVSNSMID